jgi:proton glutamate symport protein
VKIKSFLTDPKTIFGGIVGGFLIGLFLRPAGKALAPFGDLYLAFLSMCLLPILITAIVGGIGRLLRDPNTRVLFKSMVLYWFVGLVLPCVAGILTAIVFAPGSNLGPGAEKSLGSFIVEAPATERGGAGILGFIAQIIPRNVFEAVSTNQVMSVVFLSVAVGVAMGVIQARAADDALAIVEAIYEAFMQLFRWALTILAPGLLCIVAGVVAQIDAETLVALGKFVLLFYAGGIVLLVVYLLLCWLNLRRPIAQVTAELGNPTMLAFVANNPVVALPATLDTLEQKFGIDRRIPDLVIPFGIFANQHGGVFLFSYLIVFLAQIYVIDLGLQDYIVIAVGSIVAGATAVGGGPILLTAFAPILSAVGIPAALALVVLATTDALVGPMRTIVTLQSNIALTVLTARASKTSRPTSAGTSSSNPRTS